MTKMNGRHSDADRAASTARDDNGRVLGWISGLSLLVLPWFVAGFVATAATMVGPSGWSAEAVFPWAMLAGIALGLAWVVLGSLRISHFAREQSRVPRSRSGCSAGSTCSRCCCSG